jgi:hypothetical protein
MKQRLQHTADTRSSRPRSLAAAIGASAILAAAALPAGADAAIVPHVAAPSEVTTHVVTPTPSSSPQAVAPAPVPQAVAPATSPAPTPPGGSQGSGQVSHDSGSGSDQGAVNGGTWRPGGLEPDGLSGNPFTQDYALQQQAIEMAVAFANAITGLSTQAPPALPTDTSDALSEADLLEMALSWVGINYEVEDGPGNTGAK